MANTVSTRPRVISPIMTLSLRTYAKPSLILAMNEILSAVSERGTSGILNGINSNKTGTIIAEETRKVGPRPMVSMRIPPTAGPTSWPALNIVVNIATPLAMSRWPTR